MLGLGLDARNAAAFRVAGVAQTDIYRHFAWQACCGTGWRAWPFFFSGVADHALRLGPHMGGALGLGSRLRMCAFPSGAVEL